MRGFWIYLFGFTLGFGSMYFVLSGFPLPPNVHVSCIDRKEFHTVVHVKNDKPVHVVDFKFISNGMRRFKPPEPDPVFGITLPEFEKKCLILTVYNNGGKADGVVFSGEPGLRLPAGEHPVQIRIQNQDFAGMTVVGDLTVVFSNGTTLTFRGLGVEVESW